MLLRVTAEVLRLRSAPAPDAPVLATLARGDGVASVEERPAPARWIEVAAAGRRGFVARRYLAQVSTGLASSDVPATLQAELARLVWSVSVANDHIEYRLGCKARATGDEDLSFSGSDVHGQPCSGTTVDCSGWTAGLFQLIARAANVAVAAPVLPPATVARLYTHSDGQIAGVGARTGLVLTGRDIDAIPLRTGLLLGLNAGDFDWEGKDRVFEIDHVVMVAEAPDGTLSVTQSSSGGGGVNSLPYVDWRDRWASLFDTGRVHCVDPLAMGAWVAGVLPGGAIEAHEEDAEPERDPFAAEAG